MKYQVIKEYNTKIRFYLFSLENTVNDIKNVIFEKMWKSKYCIL